MSIDKAVEMLDALDNLSVCACIQKVIALRPALRSLLVAAISAPRLSEAVSELGVERLTGVIAKFDAERCYGFIDCPEVRSGLHRKVFVSDDEIGSFTVGSHVSFSLVIAERGQPQAHELEDASHLPVAQDSDVTVSGTCADVGDVNIAVNPSKRSRTSCPQSQNEGTGISLSESSVSCELRAQETPLISTTSVEPLALAQASSSRVPVSGIFAGVVKKVNAQKRFGYVECPQLKTAYSVDPFLSMHEIGEFTNGSIVTFSLRENNGRPEAYNLAAPTVAL